MSILVEGTTIESTDVDKIIDVPVQEKRLNGEAIKPRRDNEEVYIVVNNSTNVEKRVRTTISLLTFINSFFQTVSWGLFVIMIIHFNFFLNVGICKMTL